MDRHQLRRVVTRSLEEAAHGIRDRDQPPCGPREGPIDVAKGPQQVAVVVVPGRDDWRPEGAGRNRAVDVGVDEVRMEEIRLLGPNRPGHVARQPWADVGTAAHRAVRDAEPVERVVEAGRVAAGHVEPEEAGVDATLAQRREQREQVSLRAADAGQLVQVEDSHPSSRP